MDVWNIVSNNIRAVLECGISIRVVLLCLIFYWFQTITFVNIIQFQDFLRLLISYEINLSVFVNVIQREYYTGRQKRIKDFAKFLGL